MTAEFPEKLQFLFEPHRYKVPYGGRGSAKSWSIARALLIQGAQRRLRILCGRETQKSISDSVHKLLSDQITELGLRSLYDIGQAKIYGKNGTEIFFAGLRHNINNIKSVEACDVVWIEEAQAVSKASWDVLIPTIRKDGSEIWISFNPDLDTDATYQRFVVHTPPGAKVVKVNWQDNPWFPQVLRAEMEHCRATDPDAYHHIWEGECARVLAGAVYAEELRRTEADGRVMRVPYDATKPVHTFWDLGWADNTSIWFAQAVGFEYRIIDYLDGQRQPLAHYIAELQRRGYVYGTDFLPHDARAKQLGSGRSVEELMREAGRNVRIVPMLSKADGINAVRSIFPQCYFDGEKTLDGLQALRRYRYGAPSADGAQKREPLHDENSHAADAFRYLAVGLKTPKREEPAAAPRRRQYGKNGWMA